LWGKVAAVKAFLTALLSLLAAASFAQDLRVLTFNIRYNNPADGANAWQYRREAVAKLIHDRADIAGLQEVKPDQRTWLKDKLPDFGFVGIGREAGDTDESVPIVYRKDRFEVLSSGTFWLSDTPEKEASTSWGNKLPRICTFARLRDKTAQRVLWLYNVHLDHQSGMAREKGIGLVLERIAAREGDEPAILVGDFNATIGDPPLVKIAANEKPALQSTYQALSVPPEGTFHGFTGKTRTKAIDFVFVEKGKWRVKDGQVLKTTYTGVDNIERPVSDHFPVEATLVAP
jgi:endonuclease/exonuclease/phosphatase family metal-dependent hydrolase